MSCSCICQLKSLMILVFREQWRTSTYSAFCTSGTNTPRRSLVSRLRTHGVLDSRNSQLRQISFSTPRAGPRLMDTHPWRNAWKHKSASHQRRTWIPSFFVMSAPNSYVYRKYLCCTWGSGGASLLTKPGNARITVPALEVPDTKVE